MSLRREASGTPALGAALVVLFSGCSDHNGPKRHDDPPPPVAATSRDADVPRPRARSQGEVIIDMADPNAPCVFGYKGTFLEVGSRSVGAELGWKLLPPPAEWVEREGSSWAQFRGKTATIDFFTVLAADVGTDGTAGASPFVEARVRAGAARTLTFYLNGHAIGSSTLARGETRVVSVKGAAAQPVAGGNELSMRFSGWAKGSTEPAVEIEWIHLGFGEPDPLYPPPTRRDALVSRNFAGQPGRGVSLRGPGFARCEGWLPSGSSVETRAMLEGPGSADAEVRVVRDRVPPTVIGTMHLDATDTSDRIHSWPVGDLGIPGTLGAIELSVVRATKGTRVLFGEARVLAPPTSAHSLASDPAPSASGSPTRTPARGVVVIILSQLGAKSLSVYGGPLTLPAVASLASSGLVFDSHRSTTGIASGAVGSMLTGLTARELGVIDGESRLPQGVTTVADAVRQAGIASAFFTESPLTSAAFGFDRGWSYFEAHGPAEDAPATKGYDAAVTWLQEHSKSPFLVVIHARGGHPPWDLSLERIKGLPPEGYSGGLDARHAGELLGRSLRTPASFRFDDADRARAGALYATALEAEDLGVGRVLSALHTAGIFESSTVMVTGDVGLNEAARVPFAESESLDEAALHTPLVVRWAHDAPRGSHVAAATSSEDLATTILAAFGLPAPKSFHGKDLRALGDSTNATTQRALLAADQDRFSLRWAVFVSSGVKDRETKLCDLSLEEACVTDVRESYPLASRIVHSTLFEDLVRAKPSFVREPVSLDAATQAALKAWGR